MLSPSGNSCETLSAGIWNSMWKIRADQRIFRSGILRKRVKWVSGKYISPGGLLLLAFIITNRRDVWRWEELMNRAVRSNVCLFSKHSTGPGGADGWQQRLLNREENRGLKKWSWIQIAGKQKRKRSAIILTSWTANHIMSCRNGWGTGWYLWRYHYETGRSGNWLYNRTDCGDHTVYITVVLLWMTGYRA